MKVISSASIIAIASLVSSIAAHPSYAKYLDQKDIALMEAQQKRAQDTGSESEKRALGTGILGSVGNLLGGVTGIVGGAAVSVLSNVNPADKRPEPGYDFQAPGPGDQRGPCPALNLLANHGYLPRSGIVSYGDILAATAQGFNMGTDLATVLATFAVLANGDIESETFSIGGADARVPNTYPAGGLNRHSTVEADISPNREDYYLGCGDNHQLSSRRFAQNVQYANDEGGKFDFTAMGNHYAQFSKETQQYNPYLYYFPFPSIVSVVAYNFYSAFFSNGTYGAGGDPNYKSISSIIGAQQTTVNGQVEYEYVPERYPVEGWYRRATEYGAVQALTDGFLNIYPKNPVAMPFAQVDTPNLSATTLLCDLQQGVASITPLLLSGTAVSSEAAIAWAVSKLDPYFSDTILGCPASTLSNSTFYPNDMGGPFSAPPAVSANTGSNVYNQVYFPTTAGRPQHC